MVLDISLKCFILKSTVSTVINTFYGREHFPKMTYFSSTRYNYFLTDSHSQILATVVSSLSHQDCRKATVSPVLGHSIHWVVSVLKLQTPEHHGLPQLSKSELFWVSYASLKERVGVSRDKLSSGLKMLSMASVPVVIEHMWLRAVLLLQSSIQLVVRILKWQSLLK